MKPQQKNIVIPAKAGIQSPKRHARSPWIPAFAGMTPSEIEGS
jgi:hypothetical protein